MPPEWLNHFIQSNASLKLRYGPAPAWQPRSSIVLASSLPHSECKWLKSTSCDVRCQRENSGRIRGLKSLGNKPARAQERSEAFKFNLQGPGVPACRCKAETIRLSSVPVQEHMSNAIYVSQVPHDTQESRWTHRKTRSTWCCSHSPLHTLHCTLSFTREPAIRPQLLAPACGKASCSSLGSPPPINLVVIHGPAPHSSPAAGSGRRPRRASRWRAGAPAP